MEKVQRWATKMVPGLKNLQYEDRLQQLGILNLSARRLLRVLIETFKIMNSHTKGSSKKSSYLSTRHANSCKLIKPSCKKGLECNCKILHAPNRARSEIWKDHSVSLFFGRTSLSNRNIILAILLLAGDVHPNPGPINWETIYPYSYCQQHVVGPVLKLVVKLVTSGTTENGYQ